MIALAAIYNRPVHICHVSNKEEVASAEILVANCPIRTATLRSDFDHPRSEEARSSGDVRSQSASPVSDRSESTERTGHCETAAGV